MKRIFNFLSITCLTFILMSCSSEKDFSGTYYTMFAHKISNSGDIVKSDITELSLFKLNIYKSENSYAGDVECTRSAFEYELFKPLKLDSHKEKFILKNVRISGDTLFYIMSDNMGLNLDGALVKNDSTFHILDKGLSGTNIFSKQNPLFISKSDEAIKYKNMSKESEDTTRKGFIEMELSYFETVYKNKISDEELNVLRKMIE